jgi:hypothetical protein
MSTLQDQYNSIVAQLDAFLSASDLPGAISCITSPKLKEHIKEIDDNWTGLRERAPVTLPRLTDVVNTIRQGIFCGSGHIFYIQVRNVNKEGAGEYLYPSKSIPNTFQYVVPDETAYAIDIKDLSGNRTTPNLYAYESDGTLVTGTQNPFNLTTPRSRGDKSARGDIEKYLPYGFRLYAFLLDASDPTLELTLRDSTNSSVLKLHFDYARRAETRMSANLTEMRAFVNTGL